MNNFKRSFLNLALDGTLTRTVRSRELAKSFKHETIAGIHRCRDVDRFQQQIMRIGGPLVSLTVPFGGWVWLSTEMPYICVHKTNISPSKKCSWRLIFLSPSEAYHNLKQTLTFCLHVPVSCGDKIITWSSVTYN